MSFGMTWEQYWYGDVRMTRSFYEAHRLRKKRENERMWWQGMYFYDGLTAALKNFGLNLAGKSGKETYPKNPYEIFKEEPRPETPKEKEDREERERLRAEVYMRQMFEVGKNWGRK